MPPSRSRPAPAGTTPPWPALMAFERVAAHLNFARAAAEMAVTPTAISKTIRQLEDQLGVRLFNRTTRSVALTEAGSQMLEGIAPALERIRQSVQQVGETSARPRGVLKLNTSYVAYRTLLEPRLPAFLAEYPDIELDLQIDNGLADIVASGSDAGIRLGHALQLDMIAVPVGPRQPMVVVASPEYLRDRGAPTKPADLLDHECIRQRIGHRGRYLDWRFGAGSREVTIAVRGRLIFNEMRCVLDAARQGCGLAYVFQPFAAEAIAARQLTAVLERHGPAGEHFYLYYPSRSQMPGKLRALLDFLKEEDGV